VKRVQNNTTGAYYEVEIKRAQYEVYSKARYFMLGLVRSGYPSNKRPGRSRAAMNHPTVSADNKRHIFSDGRLEVLYVHHRKTAPTSSPYKLSEPLLSMILPVSAQSLLLSRGSVLVITTWRIVCSSRTMANSNVNCLLI
jgi:hypothetical protein